MSALDCDALAPHIYEMCVNATKEQEPVAIEMTAQVSNDRWIKTIVEKTQDGVCEGRAERQLLTERVQSSSVVA